MSGMGDFENLLLTSEHTGKLHSADYSAFAVESPKLESSEFGVDEFLLRNDDPQALTTVDDHAAPLETSSNIAFNPAGNSSSSSTNNFGINKMINDDIYESLIANDSSKEEKRNSITQQGSRKYTTHSLEEINLSKPLRDWEINHEKELANREVTELEFKIDGQKKAEEALRKFYAERAAEIEEVKKLNRIKEEENFKKQKECDSSKSNDSKDTWNRVWDLLFSSSPHTDFFKPSAKQTQCPVTNGFSKNFTGKTTITSGITKDTSRMKQVLDCLRNSDSTA